MLTLESPAFGHGGAIPAKYTGDGANLSPPLRWNGVPAGAKSLVLIVDDPDAPDPAAPKRVWVHLVVYNLPPTPAELPPGASGKKLPAGSREGVNDSGHSGYDGPSPPKGRHRYFHKLYALDTALPDLGARPRKIDLERAMAGHLLGQTELIGTYGRKG